MYNHYVYQYVQTLNNLDIKRAWARVGQPWRIIKEKMLSLKLVLESGDRNLGGKYDFFFFILSYERLCFCW
jgi:hypothetical protein